MTYLRNRIVGGVVVGVIMYCFYGLVRMVTG